MLIICMHSTLSSFFTEQKLPSDETRLDGNTFVITNKEYFRANLAQWGTDGRDVGTHENKVYVDQFWILEPEPHWPGYYYIKNAEYTDYRLAKWSGFWGDSGDEDVGVVNGQYHDDQLWKFESQGNDFYKIFNKEYPDARLAKWGKDDDDWGTYSGSEEYDDQIWKLTPRFRANVQEIVIWEADNRKGSNDFTEVVTVTKGLKLTSSLTLSTKVNLESSLEASIPIDAISFGVSSKIATELASSMTTTEEKSWSTATKTTFTAPKGKNYRVKQIEVDFDSVLPEDHLIFDSGYTIEETDGEFV